MAIGQIFENSRSPKIILSNINSIYIQSLGLFSSLSRFNHLFLGAFVQNLVVGRAGQCGLPVAALAEAEVARGDEHAPHPHPPMVGQTVWERVRKERPAKCKTAVSKN